MESLQIVSIRNNKKVKFPLIYIRVTIAVIKGHDQKQLGEGQDLFDLYFHIIVHLERKSGKELN